MAETHEYADVKEKLPIEYIEYQHHLDSQKLDTFIKGIEGPHCKNFII